MSRHQSFVATSLYASAGFNSSFLMSRHQLMSLQLSTGVFLCRDITLCLCRFQLFVPDVATSIPCRDISSCLCSFQQMVPDVATSISCRDINLKNCNLQLSTSYVATLIPCRDNNLCLWRLQLGAFGVATSVLCLWLILSCLTCDPCRDLHQISFNFPDVATS